MNLENKMSLAVEEILPTLLSFLPEESTIVPAAVVMLSESGSIAINGEGGNHTASQALTRVGASPASRNS